MTVVAESEIHELKVIYVGDKETIIALFVSVFMYTFVFVIANYMFGNVSNKMNGLALGIGIGCGILWRLYYRKGCGL